MIAVATVHGFLLHGIGTAIRSQRRATFIAILRAIEVFSFAPIARNHGRQKANHFSAKPRRQPTHHSQSQNGTKVTPALSNVTVLLCFFVAKLLINQASSRLLFDETV